MTNLYFLPRSGPSPARPRPPHYPEMLLNLPWDDTMYNCFHNIYYFVPPTKNSPFHHLYLKTSHSHHREGITVETNSVFVVVVSLSGLEGGGRREGTPVGDIKQRTVCSLFVASPSSSIYHHLAWLSGPTWHNSNCVSALPALA